MRKPGMRTEEGVQIEVFSLVDRDLRTGRASERLRRLTTALYEPDMQNE
jgi:hypothetical protein